MMVPKLHRLIAAIRARHLLLAAAMGVGLSAQVAPHDRWNVLSDLGLVAAAAVCALAFGFFLMRWWNRNASERAIDTCVPWVAALGLALALVQPPFPAWLAENLSALRPAWVWIFIAALPWIVNFSRSEVSANLATHLCAISAIALGVAVHASPMEALGLVLLLTFATRKTAVRSYAMPLGLIAAAYFLSLLAFSPWRRHQLLRYFDFECSTYCPDLEQTRYVLAGAQWSLPGAEATPAMGAGPSAGDLQFLLTHVVRDFGLIAAITIALTSALLISIPLLKLAVTSNLARSPAHTAVKVLTVAVGASWVGNVAACFGLIAWHPGLPLPFFSASIPWAVVGGMLIAAAFPDAPETDQRVNARRVPVVVLKRPVARTCRPRDRRRP